MSRPSKGAAFLDKVLPTWYRRVKRPVDVRSYTDCPGAQISGDFAAFALKYKLFDLTEKDPEKRIKKAIQLGFQTRGLDPNPNEVEILNRQWQEEVDKRVAAKAAKKEAEVVAT